MEMGVFAGRRYWWGIAAGIALALGLAAAETQARPGTTFRPIDDFLSNQGTYCVEDDDGGCMLLVPPVDNFLGWTDEDRGLAVSVDYAGLASEFLEARGGPPLGTKIKGIVIERPLPDGRADVRILLDTRDALTWVIDGADFAGDPLLLGSRPQDVLADQEPALGDSFLQVRFINTAPGAPLPDLVQLAFFPAPGQELRSMSFQARAHGPLRARLGVPEGTPGSTEIVQSSAFSTSAAGVLSEDASTQRIRLQIAGK